MNIYIFLILFVLWYVLSLWVSETYGKRGKIGEEWSFFLCFMLSPPIGFLITYLVGRKAV